MDTARRMSFQNIICSVSCPQAQLHIRTSLGREHQGEEDSGHTHTHAKEQRDREIERERARERERDRERESERERERERETEIKRERETGRQGGGKCICCTFSVGMRHAMLCRDGVQHKLSDSCPGNVVLTLLDSMPCPRIDCQHWREL